MSNSEPRKYPQKLYATLKNSWQLPDDERKLKRLTLVERVLLYKIHVKATLLCALEQVNCKPWLVKPPKAIFQNRQTLPDDAYIFFCKKLDNKRTKY